MIAKREVKRLGWVLRAAEKAELEGRSIVLLSRFIDRTLNLDYKSCCVGSTKTTELEQLIREGWYMFSVKTVKEGLVYKTYAHFSKKIT